MNGISIRPDLKRVPLIISAVLFLSAAFTQALDGDAPSYGDAMVAGSISDARTLIPILASDSASSSVCGMIFNGLVKYDKDVRIVPDLAKSWEVSADGREIVFHLRDDVAWHDGAPFTARDVEFTYIRLIDPSVKTPYSGDFALIWKFEVIDDYTITVSYTHLTLPTILRV